MRGDDNYRQKGNRPQKRKLEATALTPSLVCNFDKLKKLLEDGIEINYQDPKYRRNFLHFIGAWDEKVERLHALELVLSKGVDVNLRDLCGKTALHVFAERCLDGVKILLDRGAEINIKSMTGCVPLEQACRFGQLEIVRELITRGAEINLVCSEELSPLFFAIKGGSLEVVKEMLDRGADLHFTHPSGYTTLMHAASWKQIEIAKELLKRGANAAARESGTGWTALFYAVDRGLLEVVKDLVENGHADVNARSDGSSLQETVMEIAKRQGHMDIVNYFQERNNDANHLMK